MKMKRLLMVFAFALAIGSAVASDYFAAPLGYSSKLDVPVQAANCEARIECPGGDSFCQISIDHDGSQSTGNVTVQLYDGTLDAPDDHPVCGDIMRKD